MIEEIEGLLAARLGAKVLAGGPMEVDVRIARAAGDLVKKRLIESIRRLNAPPNAPATLAQKSGDSPLVDTEETIEAIEVKVRTARRRGR